MKHKIHTEALLLLALSLAVSQAQDDEENPDCSYIKTGPFEDLILNATSDLVSPEKLKAMKNKSRVCLPTPCQDLEAYSGFFPVDDSFSSNMFFLHIKSKKAMTHKRHTEVLLLFVLSLTLSQCNDDEGKPDCSYITGQKFADLFLSATNDETSWEKLQEMKKDTRACLPEPADKLEAYSGFIPVAKDKYMFFLHIKSPEDTGNKPLLLWLQGGPGKSSLFGQFLENGPLGINASGGLYYRKHTLLTEMNIIYVDQPVGAGYSVGEKLTGTLKEASIELIEFIRQFMRIFKEYEGRKFYVAGESYGARSAVGVVQRILTEDSIKRLLKFDGVMLGVGFLFPLLELINSADYLYHSGVLDENSRYKFAEQFETIAHLVQKKDFLNAAKLLSVTVMNLNPGGQKSLFQQLTGFEHHASIATAERPQETKAYSDYANSEDFKKRIHVDPVRQLDATRVKLAMQLAVQDFFVDISETLVYVLNNARVLMYVAEYDAVFPAFNIEDQFRKVEWRGAEIYRKACRMHWHRNGNSSEELRGYETVAGAVVFATVLFGGHYISLDRSVAVSELYSRFLSFPDRVNRGEINTTAAC